MIHLTRFLASGFLCHSGLFSLRFMLLRRAKKQPRAEINRKTVIDHNPEHPQAREYRHLAEAIENNTQFVIPKPMTQERLEEILIEFGLMENLKDNYVI